MAFNGFKEERKMNNNGFDQLMTNFSEVKLMESRTIFISEGINSAVAKRVINSLLIFDEENSAKPVYIYLNSPGGEVNSGFAIYDTIRYIKADVRIITTGLCASIATIINLAAPKKHRYSMPNGRFLIHQPLIGGQIQGQASDLEITAREIIKTRKRLNELLAQECGQPLEKVEEDTTRDYWMTAEEALEYGLVTKIVEKKSEIG